MNLLSSSLHSPLLLRPALERLRGYFRLSTKRRTSSTASQSEDKAGEGAVEQGLRLKSTRHQQKKRASESSALTTVSSIRSSAGGRPGGDRCQQVVVVSVAEGGGGRQGKGLRTPSTKAVGRHFHFRPPSGLVGTHRPSSEQLSVQSSISNLAETSSNLERDLEIIDLLERERSMDIQQGLARERLLEAGGLRPVVVVGERRRQLPSVGVRQGHSRRNLVTDTDQFDRLLTSELSPRSVPGR